MWFGKVYIAQLAPIVQWSLGMETSLTKFSLNWVHFRTQQPWRTDVASVTVLVDAKSGTFHTSISSKAC